MAEKNIVCTIKKYNTVESRLSTFSNFGKDCVISPQKLAEAGLFFVGPGDKVQCAYCLGKLYNFEKGDDPFLEHLKHFRKCRYIQFRLLKNGSLMQNDSLKTMESFLLPKIQIVKRLGYHERLIERALTHLRDRGIISINCVDILKELDILEAEEQNSLDAMVDGVKTEYLQVKKDTEELHKQIIEYKKLKNLCMKCKVNKSNTLCLPCRHIVLCITCIDSIDCCLKCNTKFLGCVRVFRS